MIHFPVPEVEAFCGRERVPLLRNERESAAEILTLSLPKGKDLGLLRYIGRAR